MALLSCNYGRLTLWSKHVLCSSVISQISPRHKSYESKKWPGYYVIYNVENIRTVNIVNRLKYRTTLGFGVIIPLFTGLEMTTNFPLSMVQSTALVGGVATIFFHSLGYFCNNVIGLIYSKKNNSDVKISYVSYWGKRVDIDTTYDDVVFSESSKTIFNPLFDSLTIPSTNKKLRLFVNGKITDKKEFDKILGIDF